MYDFNAAGDKMMDCWSVDDVRQIGLEVCTQALMLQQERDAAIQQLRGKCSSCANYSAYHMQGK